VDAPIGVFDSGVGGLSVLRALRAELRHEDFVYFADSGHAPYGERDDAFVAGRTLAVAEELLAAHRIKALVVACNTATAAAIHLLRERHPELPLVGVEPALKPAALHSRTKRIAVLATRGTLASAKFSLLHASLTADAEFVLQPCDGLADAIERGDAERTASLCAHYTGSLGPFGLQPGQIDTLVMGCTHYPFAATQLRDCVGTAVEFVETGEPVARQTRRILEAKALLRSATGVAGQLTLLGTGPRAPLEAAVARWLPG
jgi:glutamate racemase